VRYLTPPDLEGALNFHAVILGSGIGGLFCALNLPRDMKVAVVSTAVPKDTNSGLAQGGIAICQGTDDLESHVEDTLRAGCGHNDPEAVRTMVMESPQVAEDLIRLGVNFDRRPDGSLKLTREGGHSRNRILHAKDSTGAEIVRALFAEAQRRDNIHFIMETFAVDVITDLDGNAAGVSLLGPGPSAILAPHVVVATGGIGRLYESTTNMRYSSGDGIAMAMRAGADLMDMEFVQFHPTALHSPSSSRSFLISEAVRGEGGILRNPKGEPFMEGEHPLKDLAPRDVVARAVVRQMALHSSPCVYLDVTHLDGGFLKSRFPGIYARCLEEGIDITSQWIPVRPVAHYLMGGVLTDLWGRTSVPGLYACGEAARTGVHGANRLASNSLLEALVFAKRIARRIPEEPADRGPVRVPREDRSPCGEDLQGIMDLIRRIMTRHAFVIRTRRGLQEALDQVGGIMRHLEGLELRSTEAFEAFNMAQVARAVLSAALSRPGSLGSHWIEG